MQNHNPEQKTPQTAGLAVSGDIVKIWEICCSLSCLTGAKPPVDELPYIDVRIPHKPPKKRERKKLAGSSEAESKQQHLHLATGSSEG